MNNPIKIILLSIVLISCHESSICFSKKASADEKMILQYLKNKDVITFDRGYGFLYQFYICGDSNFHTLILKHDSVFFQSKGKSNFISQSGDCVKNILLPNWVLECSKIAYFFKQNNISYSIAYHSQEKKLVVLHKFDDHFLAFTNDTLSILKTRLRDLSNCSMFGIGNFKPKMTVEHLLRRENIKVLGVLPDSID